MKSMTCAQLGGPCDLVHSGNDADQVIRSQDQHLKDAVAAGDTAHEHAAAAMRARWRNPIKGMGWYKATKKAFAELPES
jgi:predicted small metal-binding protein